ncbi:MAG: hypothetical protein NC122_07140 [Faecalibacterium sp.]|nr:hypothetical protein [Ruminococcus sp.]MCM1391183.1 hypothetical protein [Ruminococcus sp.]MCM1485966.1 hypothetical protein [Faecalibacterium sp.]
MCSPQVLAHGSYCGEDCAIGKRKAHVVRGKIMLRIKDCGNGQFSRMPLRVITPQSASLTAPLSGRAF